MEGENGETMSTDNHFGEFYYEQAQRNYLITMLILLDYNEGALQDVKFIYK